MQKIPREFSSLDNYFKAFIAPLVEETRSQISSSLEVIREAPYSEIISMEAEKDTRLLYKMNLDIGYTSDAYVARNGDILILFSFKPRIVEDLLHCGATHYVRYDFQGRLMGICRGGSASHPYHTVSTNYTFVGVVPRPPLQIDL